MKLQQIHSSMMQSGLDMEQDHYNDYLGACLPTYESQSEVTLTESGAIGYFVQDREILGRSWGGFRVAQDLTLPEVRVLARCMTVKSVLAGVPVGGAKGGVRLPHIPAEQHSLLDMISRLVGRHLRKQSYFLGSDIGFSEQEANQVYALSKARRRLFSGRLSAGACCAQSVLACIEHVKRTYSRVNSTTVAVEGFGNMAASTAKLLAANGYRIIAISNVNGTLQDPRGLDIEELASRNRVDSEFLAHYCSQARTSTFHAGEPINSQECDILVPGARVFSIDHEIAKTVNAKIVVPIANSPITCQGERVLADRGVVSVPDVISNSGAIIGSFAQQLGATECQTSRIIREIVDSNLKTIISEQTAGQIPKLLAIGIAVERMKLLERSERITALRWLFPWFRSLGTKSAVHASRKYMAMKISSKLPA